jgi:hypothetical protein
MSEKTEIEARYLDKRTIQRYITQGLVDEKTYERHLKSLGDLAEKATRIDTISEDDPIDEES